MLCAVVHAPPGTPADVPQATPIPTPQVLEGLRRNEEGIPLLDVYLHEEEAIRSMDIERYVCGVLAGEMRNDWPLEALKAQAHPGRTFVLKFVSEKESRYEGADISTDITEAQAYNAAEINERIEQAVAETCGQVLLTASGSCPMRGSTPIPVERPPWPGRGLAGMIPSLPTPA